MQTEVSIAKPLSGPEALEAVLHDIRTVLSKDDRFMSHTSFKGLETKVRIEVRENPLGFLPPVERELVTSVGDISELPEKPDAIHETSISEKSPNKIRESHDMKQPVLVSDGQGQSHEEWKKVDKKPPQQKVPHNKVVGV